METPDGKCHQHGNPERGGSLATSRQTIADDAQALSAQLKAMRERLFPPASQKTLRSFTSGEAAKLIGVSDAICGSSRWQARGRSRMSEPADGAIIRSPI